MEVIVRKIFNNTEKFFNTSVKDMKHSRVFACKDRSDSEVRSSLTFLYFLNTIRLILIMRKIQNKERERPSFTNDAYIHKRPGRPDEHTIYFKDGDSILAQWTRQDAVLPNIDLGFVPNIKEDSFLTEIDFSLINQALAPTLALLLTILAFSKMKNFSLPLNYKYVLLVLLYVYCSGGDKKALPFAVLMLNSGITEDTPSIGEAGDPCLVLK